MKVLIIVPAYNEEKTIGVILGNLKALKIGEIKKEIVVVNDGSGDQTAKIAAKQNITLLNHVLNRGLGGALQTGFAYAKSRDADFVVTIDSDGQHDPKDIKKLLSPLLEGRADAVIGSRMLEGGKMPIDRRIINYLANLVTYLLWSVWITDTQSGLRAFTINAARKIDIKTNRMEVSSEFAKEIARNHFRVAEVPIRAIYTDYSRQKGQKNANAFNILVKLLIHKFADIK